MEYLILDDTAIFAVNCGRRQNEASDLVYRDRDGALHVIDFARCAENFRSEHRASSGACIGERNRDQWCFVFCTSGVKTKVVFRKAYVSSLFRYHRLVGSRASRFRSLQELISRTGYSTYDLS